MKKNDVRIGGTYLAKVSGNIAKVRIDAENQHGGWDATNLATKKGVRIKRAQRLRAAADGLDDARSAAIAKLAAPHAPDAPKAPAAAKAAKAAKTPKAPAAAKPAKAKAPPAPSAPNAPRPKRVSCLDAAAIVVVDADKPMKAVEMIAEIQKRRLWSSPEGKTPEATLYAAVIREIAAKGKAARFRKVERGLFAAGKGA